MEDRSASDVNYNKGLSFNHQSQIDSMFPRVCAVTYDRRRVLPILLPYCYVFGYFIAWQHGIFAKVRMREGCLSLKRPLQTI